MIRLLWVSAAFLFALSSGAMAAGRCGKYKMDGTGNCLTPAFYKCTRDWAKCSKACEAKAKASASACAEACDAKYSVICGD
jgi:hypothetical protein